VTRRRGFFENIGKSKHTAPLLRGMLDGKGKVFPILLSNGHNSIVWCPCG